MTGSASASTTSTATSADDQPEQVIRQPLQVIRQPEQVIRRQETGSASYRCYGFGFVQVTSSSGM
jgi:hypothetical protein